MVVVFTQRLGDLIYTGASSHAYIVLVLIAPWRRLVPNFLAVKLSYTYYRVDLYHEGLETWVCMMESYANRKIKKIIFMFIVLLE